MNSTAVDRLRRFASRATDHSTCDLCRSDLMDRHRHLLELAHRRLLCACDACALLFCDTNGSRFRPIPQSITRIDLKLSDAQWSGLGIPIGMAFFTVRERAQLPDPSPVDCDLTTKFFDNLGGHRQVTSAAQAAVVTMDSPMAPVQVGYPSPAGPVISSVEQNRWKAFLDANPGLHGLQPEVESLLINRTTEHPRAFVVPLDLCFKLIGIVRRHWQGWSGGPEVHREIDRYFDRLDLSAEQGPQS